MLFGWFVNSFTVFGPLPEKTVIRNVGTTCSTILQNDFTYFQTCTCMLSNITPFYTLPHHNVDSHPKLFLNRLKETSMKDAALKY